MDDLQILSTVYISCHSLIHNSSDVCCLSDHRAGSNMTSLVY